MKECGQRTTFREGSPLIVPLRKWLERARYIAVFLLLTFLLHELMACAADYVKPRHRFEEPSGGAVKAQARGPGVSEADSALERLRFFYWYGE